MSRRVELCEQTGVNIYFCDQHSPWQRGTCENTDCLLRKYQYQCRCSQFLTGVEMRNPKAATRQYPFSAIPAYNFLQT